MDEELNAQEQARALKALLDSKGWAIVKGILDQQVSARLHDLVVVPLASLDGALAQEFAKGEIAGIKSIVTTLEALYEDVSQLAADQLEKEAQDDNEDLDDTGPGGYDDAEFAP